MRAAIAACLAAGVAVGAHPGYEDRSHFGRRPLALPAAEAGRQVERQLREFTRIAAELGAQVHHVTPHGALYNQADRDPALAAAVTQAAARVFPGCAYYVPPAGELAKAGVRAGLHVRPEGFADRRYLKDGRLVPRGTPGAAIDDPAVAAQQALEIGRAGRVQTAGGAWLPLPAATRCGQGDGPQALAVLRAVRSALEAAGLVIRA